MAKGKARTLRMDSAAAARLALGALAALVVLLGVAFALAAGAIARSGDRMARANLSAAAAAIAQAIPRDSLFVLDASFDPAEGATSLDAFREYIDLGLPGTEQLAAAIAEANRQSPDLAIRVLSPDGIVLFDATGPVMDGAAAPHAGEDADAIRRAAGGQAASSVPAPRGPLRVYQPRRGGTGDVVALIAVSSDQGFRIDARAVLRRAALAALLAAALIAAAWASLSRLVTRIRLAERAADQSDRLRALGTATAGIAHEIRNPLSIIGLAIEELRAGARRLPEGPQREGLLATIDDLQGEARRLRDLTDQFLDFARDRPRDESEVIDLAAKATETARLFAKGAREGLAVDVAAEGGPLPVRFGGDRLRQVLLNLLRNAEQAAPAQGARIAVRAARHGAAAVLEVEDNGPGMDAETLAQAFDPFFTTRAEGSGLGLALSRSLVEAAGGSLQMKSAPGRGALAVVSLPLAEGALLPDRLLPDGP